MKKQNKKLPLILAAVLCVLLAAGVCFLAVRTLRLGQETQQLDEQFEKELEESRKTIDQLKEQETEMEADISRTEEEKKNPEAQEQDADGTSGEVPSVTPTPKPLLVSLKDCQPGERLSPETLYMDNPGIYFTAAQIREGDEVWERISSLLPEEESAVQPDQLRYIKMPFYDQNGDILVGEMAVNAEISQKVLDAFLELFQEKRQLASCILEENLWTEAADWTALKNQYHLTYE